METTGPSTDPLDAVHDVSTALARHTRTLDDRLTLVMVRMVIVALMFGGACFVFGMIYLQIVNSHNMWKPAALHQPSVAFGIVEAGLIVVSWAVFFWGRWGGLYVREWSNLTIATALAALLGLAAFGMHIYELHSPGFHLQSAYAGIFIVTEGIFTVLLGVAVLLLIGIANRARLNRFSSSGIAVEAMSEFYGFIAAVAVFNFLMLYIQPFFHSA